MSGLLAINMTYEGDQTYATPKYAILAYYFERKAIENKQVQDELSALPLST